MARPEFGVGEECQEATLFVWDDIPLEDIAFPSVHWALDHYKAVEGEDDFAPNENAEVDPNYFKSQSAESPDVVASPSEI